MTTLTILSPRQERILSFVRWYMREHQVPPSIREIMDGAGISSTSVVVYNIRALERAGLMRRSGLSYDTRNLRLIGPECPYCGHPR